MPELTIRPAGSEDVEEILTVLKASLGETPTLRRTHELWDWKHVHNPFGRSLVYVAEIEGRIVGVRAMMRWRLDTTDGSSIECARPVDTATHPDFTRRGIFRELTLHAVEKARSSGVALIFNTPNDKSAPGYLTMGWKEVGRIGVLARPRIGVAASDDPHRPPTVATLAPGLASAEHLPLALERRSPRGLRTPRSREYLSWRFQQHPYADYGWAGSPDGAVAVARASTRGNRSELVLSDLLGDAKPDVVRQLRRHSRARYVAGWFSRTSPERRVAVLGGLIPAPFLRTLRLVALPLTRIETNVFDLGSWDLATSDLELL